MIRSSAESRHLWTAGFVGFVLVFVMAAGVGIGAGSFARPAFVLCALLTVTSVTWYSPLRATRVALALLFVTPFAMVVTQLKPDQVNYDALYALAILPVAVVVCARARRIVFDSGALLLTAILVSSLITLLTGGTLASGYGYLLWPLITLALYLVVLNSAENSHAWLLKLIVVFSLIQATLGICQSLLQWPVFALATSTIYASDRGLLGFVLAGASRSVANGSGTFAHFNGLGSLLALSVPISVGWLLESPRSFRRLLPFVILATGLLMSYSRGGWVGGAVGCILVYWASRPKASRSWVPIMAASVLLATAFLAPYLAAYYGATQNVSSRIATWRYAVDYWLQHADRIPFGFGFGSFQQTILAQRVSLGGVTLSALHSSLLQILLEIGIAGMLLFGWFLVTTIRPYVARRRPGWQTWALGGMVGFLVSQIFDNALFGMTGTCAFALAACLRRADAREDEE